MSPAKEAPRSLIDNSSFELTVPAGKVPAGWALNSGYPGVMTVVAGGAADGERSVRVTSGPSRDAQFYRPVSAIRPGKWYRISAAVQDGSATVLVYECRTGGAVKAHSVVSGTGPRDSFRRITGFFMPVAEGFASASVALLVPKGASAEPYAGDLFLRVSRTWPVGE